MAGLGHDYTDDNDDTPHATRVGHTKADPTDVYVGRGPDGRHLRTTTEIGARGWLGNPYPVGDQYTRRESIAEFRDDFEHQLEHDPEFREAVAELAGATLGCWCQRLGDDGPPCHGEVIAEWADRLRPSNARDDREGHTE